LAAGELLHFGDEVLFFIVDGVFGAELEAGDAFIGGAGGGDGMGVFGAGEHDGHGADTAGTAVDQDYLAGAKSATGDGVVVNGEEIFGQGSCFDEGPIGWDG